MYKIDYSIKHQLRFLSYNAAQHVLMLHITIACVKQHFHNRVVVGALKVWRSVHKLHIIGYVYKSDPVQSMSAREPSRSGQTGRDVLFFFAVN
jgi:hypothetical protein